jgi:biopolymer transport protein ExbD
MAVRKLEEINAGSMADIAFLLLIFFLVTTTMEVDAGISRNLPLKRELPPDFKPPPVHDRDILIIMANSRDELLVEGEFMLIEDLEEKVREFYLANANGRDNDPTMPEYKLVDGGTIQLKLAEYQAALEKNPKDEIAKEELNKWEKRKITFQEIGVYSEISNSALIQLKNQSNTSYGLYIQVQDILKKVVNDLRNEKSEELGWGEYKNLDSDDPDDQEKIEMLQVLIPERIIEAKIEL